MLFFNYYLWHTIHYVWIMMLCFDFDFLFNVCVCWRSLLFSFVYFMCGQVCVYLFCLCFRFVFLFMIYCTQFMILSNDYVFWFRCSFVCMCMLKAKCGSWLLDLFWIALGWSLNRICYNFSAVLADCPKFLSFQILHGKRLFGILLRAFRELLKVQL